MCPVLGARDTGMLCRTSLWNTPMNLLKRLLLLFPLRRLFNKNRVGSGRHVTARPFMPVLRAEPLEGRDQPGSLLDTLLAAALSNAVTNPIDDTAPSGSLSGTQDSLVSQSSTSFFEPMSSEAVAQENGMSGEAKGGGY